jgi:hypothetical protein
MGDMKNLYRMIIVKPEWKRCITRSVDRWEGNTKIDPYEITFEDVSWNRLAQDRDQWRALVYAVMTLQLP